MLAVKALALMNTVSPAKAALLAAEASNAIQRILRNVVFMGWQVLTGGNGEAARPASA